MKDNLQKSQESMEREAHPPPASPPPPPLNKCQTALSVGQNSASQRTSALAKQTGGVCYRDWPKKAIWRRRTGNSLSCLCLIWQLDSPCQCAVAFSAPSLFRELIASLATAPPCSAWACLGGFGRVVGHFFLLKILWLSCMCADCFHFQLVENPKHISRWDNKALTAETSPEGPTVCVCLCVCFSHETSNKWTHGSRLCLCKKQQQKNVLVVCFTWSWDFWWLGCRLIFCLQSNVRGARSWVEARVWRRNTPIQQYIIGWEPSALPHWRMPANLCVSFPSNL